MNHTHDTVSKQPEPMYVEHHNLLDWKAIFAGVIITFMGFMILTALGAGIGGATAAHVIATQRGGWGLATGAGLWLGLSMVLALFAGSYFTLRISKYVTNRIGAAHGFVVSSIFFISLLLGTGTTLGTLSSAFGGMVGTLGSGNAMDVANNAAIQDVIVQGIGDANLKSDPRMVVQGIAVRLLQGDLTSVRNYLAYQTGMSLNDADVVVSSMKANFDLTVQNIAQASARGMASAGISLFVTFLVGLLGALAGGRVGAHANADRPMAEKEYVTTTTKYETRVPASA